MTKQSDMTTRPSLWHSCRRWLLPLSVAWLAGCAGSPTAQDYAGEKPVFSIRDYFNGQVSAHGLVTDRSGRVVRRFIVSMDCQWSGQTGELKERFVFSDGEKQERIWQLTEVAPGRYEGRAADVVGVAQGSLAGNALNLRYTLALPVSGRIINVDFDDWLFLMDDGKTVLNRARMSKWGFHVGDLTVTFSKP